MQIFLSSKAEKQLSKLPRKMRDVIISRIERLAEDPLARSKKLRNREGWRYRVGDYRVLYTIENKKLIILSVAHRKEVYRIKV